MVRIFYSKLQRFLVHQRFYPSITDSGVAYSGARDSEAGHNLSLAAGFHWSRAAPSSTSERCGISLFYPHGAASGASYWLGQSVSGWGVYREGRPAPGDGSPPGGNICPAGVSSSFRLSSSSARLCATVVTERSSTVRHCGHGGEASCAQGGCIARLPSSYLSRLPR
jgi:hypothetical protein